MADRLLEKPEKSTTLNLTQVGVGAGLLFQLADDAISKFQSYELKPSEIVSMAVSDIKPDDIIQLTEHLKTGSESYMGLAFALILTVVYVVKQAVLKYFELKGMVAIEIAKIQIEVETMKAKARKEIEAIQSAPTHTQVPPVTVTTSTSVENPDERADIIIS